MAPWCTTWLSIITLWFIPRSFASTSAGGRPSIGGTTYSKVPNGSNGAGER